MNNRTQPLQRLSGAIQPFVRSIRSAGTEIAIGNNSSRAQQIPRPKVGRSFDVLGRRPNPLQLAHKPVASDHRELLRSSDGFIQTLARGAIPTSVGRAIQDVIEGNEDADGQFLEE